MFRVRADGNGHVKEDLKSRGALGVLLRTSRWSPWRGGFPWGLPEA